MTSPSRVMALALLAAVLAGCGGGSGGGGGGGGALSDGPSRPAAQASGVVGPAGGTVTVTRGTLSGASVTIPPGALARSVEITISEGTPVVAEGFSAWGPPVAFGPTGLQFALPVAVTLPMPALPPDRSEATFVVLHADRRDPDGLAVLLDPEAQNGDRTLTVQQTGFSTSQAATGGFRVTLVNTSGVADHQVYVTQYGQGVDAGGGANGVFHYYGFDGQPMHPFTTFASTPVGTSYSFPLATATGAAAPGFTKVGEHSYAWQSPFDDMKSGRVAVSLNGGINIGINSGGGFAEQSFSGNPGYLTPFDFMELDCYTDSGVKNVFVNTTNVDAFGLALGLDLKTVGGDHFFGFDSQYSRAQIVSAFQSQLPTAFQQGGAFGCFVKDGPTVVRVLSPVQLLALNNSGPLSTYMDPAVASGWTHYQSTPLTINYQGFGYTGQTDGSGQNLVMTCTAVPDSGATTGKVGDQYVLPRPSTAIVFQGTDPAGPGAGNNPWYNYIPDASSNVLAKAAHNKLTALLTAALVRGVFNDVSQWGVAASFYQAAPNNSYSGLLHQFAVNRLCYGFGYDDIYDQAPAISVKLDDLANADGLVIKIPQYP